MNLSAQTCSDSACAASSVTTRPAFTSREDAEGVHLSVALPGVLKDDLKLSVHDGVLQLDAERRDLTPPVRYRFSARLATRLDGGKISAKLESGVLEATLPLKEEAQPRSIPVG